MKDLQEDIQTGNFKNVYLLYGEEAFLKQQYKKRLLQALDPDGDTMNMATYQGKNIDVGPLLELAEELGGIRCRMFTLRDPGLMHKAAKVAEELSDAAREYQEWLQELLETVDQEPGEKS